MLKLGKLTDYATVLLAAMAADPARRMAAAELAAQTQVAAPTVAKLMKQLQRGGLVQSLRGARGGYQLVRTPTQISVADVIAALEGPIAVTDCAAHEGHCAIEVGCAARGPFRLINTAIREALEAVTLADMAASVAAKKPRTFVESPIQFHPARSQVTRHDRRR